MTATEIAMLGIGISLAMALFGLFFALGSYAERVKALETWRGEMKLEFNAIHESIRELGRLIRNGDA